MKRFNNDKLGILYKLLHKREKLILIQFLRIKYLWRKDGLEYIYYSNSYKKKIMDKSLRSLKF